MKRPIVAYHATIQICLLFELASCALFESRLQCYKNQPVETYLSEAPRFHLSTLLHRGYSQ